MSEWPEIETYRALLSPLISGLSIEGTTVNREKSINESAEEFGSGLSGRKILFVERRGKHLIFHLDDGNRLLINLMAGDWIYYGREGEKPDGEYALILELEDGNRIFFGGLRHGYAYRISAKKLIEFLRPLGPDPFDPRLSADSFGVRLRTKRSKLKSALVDPKFISGIGNAYADEILFEAELRPDSVIAAMSGDEMRKVYDSMRKVLEEAARSGGAIAVRFSAEDMLTGGYRDSFKVYERAGEACARCGGTIVLETVSNRKSYYCPSCQK
ncbi:Fpg/Nei family DNA glycosylase [Cohnella thailandensis]|uniref:Formamidopyrimidine-DNA glycosylase n=1 Tax=Cohnella thailandensis TaxID=557557 RepID=A0A841T7X2_9BACL|nr:Fpg/Nei family DNA glycosylase [Cohnella thailandensis]MBB6638348.1 Fpg/Nei family DNA glycosylase [Cohnella thailandensis]MBP1977174.1 formamidopyrimidine-DNA glycosylase [Cohnella thailandensis]